jgi:hypothetical protein
MQVVSLLSPRDGQCTLARPLQQLALAITWLPLALQMLVPAPGGSSPFGVQVFVVAPPAPTSAAASVAVGSSPPDGGTAQPAVAANRTTDNNQVDGRSLMASDGTLAPIARVRTALSRFAAQASLGSCEWARKSSTQEPIRCSPA